MLVIGVYEDGALPCGRVDDRFNQFVGPLLAVVHVVGILLGLPVRQVVDPHPEQPEGVLDHSRERAG